ncbi:putative cyclic di-GMP phosphodiesterase VC_1348 [Gammaproteobacteria bacterium]
MNINLPTILVVDDEPQNLQIISAQLKDRYRVKIATTGEKALTLAAALDRPDLILLDVVISDLDGYEVCRRLKANPVTATIPVIFLTGKTSIDDETYGFAVGAVDYIHKPFSPSIVRARVQTHLSLVRTVELENSYNAALQMIAKAAEFNDSDTGLHVWRMAAYCHALAEAIGWPTPRIQLLEQAAPMHDIGKIGIPNGILKKPGKLDATEWAQMRTHPQIGYDILIQSDAPLFRLAAEISLRHHEKWDGSGYPDGLIGEAIPESARIAAIADVFDALSMQRPYKESWPLTRIMDTLKSERGKHFDPKLIDAFLNILPNILEIKEEWEAQEEIRQHY